MVGGRSRNSAKSASSEGGVLIRAKLFLALSLASSLAANGDPLIDFDNSLPTLTDPVMDQAQMISPSKRAELNEYLRSLRARGGPQVAVLTLVDLNGLPVEQASIRVVDKWQLGSKEKDDGVLILISKSERAMRIEVGQGLEGAIPDAYAKRMIDQLMIPSFRQGDFGGGVEQAIYRIVELSNPELATEQPKRYRGIYVEHNLKPNWLHLLGLFIMAWFFLFTKIGRWILVMMLFSSRGGSSHRGGWRGGSGGGFGGGGFGGGGGGFSGGGASGRW
jgi:uncharacterized protein